MSRYNFSEAIGTDEGIPRHPRLNARQRAALTGVARNNAEAAHIQSFLDTIGKGMHFKGPTAVLPQLRGLKAALDSLNGKLTLTAEKPVYADAWATADGNRRTVDEALEVAGANLRRAISGGDLGAAYGHLDMMRAAVDSASDEGRA